MQGSLLVIRRSQTAVVTCLHLYSHPLLSIHALSFLPLPPTGNSDGGSGSGVTKPKLLCSVEGATYSECGAACPPTCLTPAILCLIQGCFPGCTCPDGQLIDEVNNRCVPLEQCPPLGTCFYNLLSKGIDGGQFLRFTVLLSFVILYEIQMLMHDRN